MGVNSHSHVAQKTGSNRLVLFFIYLHEINMTAPTPPTTPLPTRPALPWELGTAGKQVNKRNIVRHNKPLGLEQRVNSQALTTKYCLHLLQLWCYTQDITSV